MERLRTANNEISRLAQADIRSFFGSLNLDRPEASRNALLAYLPALTDRYGDLAADVASEWFDEIAAGSTARRFRAQPAALIPHVAVEQTTRWAAGGLFDGHINTLGVLAVAVSKWSPQPGRDTVSLNAYRSGARWARVPQGSETCAFCLMTASRGFAYRSQQTAGDANKYHGDCDCLPVPDWSDDPRLEGYDPDDLYAKYSEARSVAGDGSTNSILAALRVEQGIH